MLHLSQRVTGSLVESTGSMFSYHTLLKDRPQQTVLTQTRHHIVQYLIKVYTVCHTSSSFETNYGMELFFFCFFFFYLDFTALSRIFHLYRADRSSKVGENRRTRGKTIRPSISRAWLSHVTRARLETQ